MGCQSSTQSSAHAQKRSIRSFKLTKIGVYSVDKYIEQMEEVIERFAKLTEDIEKKRHRFDSLTGFDAYRVYGTRIRHSTIGMLLQMYSAANGDRSKVDIGIKEQKPFIKFGMKGLTMEGLDH